jgi:hypothetical protein
VAKINIVQRCTQALLMFLHYVQPILLCDNYVQYQTSMVEFIQLPCAYGFLPPESLWKCKQVIYVWVVMHLPCFLLLARFYPIRLYFSHATRKWKSYVMVSCESILVSLHWAVGHTNILKSLLNNLDTNVSMMCTLLYMLINGKMCTDNNNNNNIGN